MHIRAKALDCSVPGIDQILSIVSQQGADELRLGTDQEPQVLSRGARKKFVMSATPEPVLRHLLGELLTPERDRQLRAGSRLEFDYDASGIGRFHVVLAARQDKGLDVIFASSVGRSSAAVPRAAHEAPHAPLDQRMSPTDISTTATGSNTQNPEPAIRGQSQRKLDSEVRFFNELNELVMRAVSSRASDIHLADDEPPYLRVDGQLQRVNDSPSLRVDSLFSIDEGLQQRIASGASAEFSLDLNSQERLRVSLYRTSSGLAAAIRLLPNQAPTLKSLNLPVSLESLAQVPQGLVLVCGATGSGKSSTLAGLARHALESRSIALVTLEDPIEFRLNSSNRSIVRQRQLGRDVADFASGLRDALRGDPDVILVGELRDAETIRLAITAAETGHLVLASLHSGSASSCVERVIDAYPNEQRSQIRVQLADALRAVVVQKLLPSARGQGRVAALEVLRVTHAVANVIREGKTAQLSSVIQAGSRDGMVSLDRCLAECVQAGTITVQVARGAANDQDSLSMYLAK
jgi:twitching motility protein PilT